MSAILPQILRDNMDKWEYDENGRMVAVKGASFAVIKAINNLNRLEEEENGSDDDVIIDG